MIQKYFSLLFALLTSSFVLAQNPHSNENTFQVKERYNWLTVGLEVAHFADLPKGLIGNDRDPLDLAFSFSHEKSRFDIGTGVYVEAQLSPIIGVQGSFHLGSSSGVNDRAYYESSIKRYHAGAVFSFTNMTTKKADPYVNIFATAGIGIISYDAQQFFFSGAKNMARKAVASQIDLGVGARYHFSEKIRIEFSSTYNVVWDNGFDGDKFNYADGQDQYLKTALGIAYTLGSSKYLSLHKTPVLSRKYITLDNDKLKNELQDYVDEKVKKLEDDIDGLHNKTDALADRMDNLEDQFNKFVEKFENGQVKYFRNVFFAFDKYYITRLYQKNVFEVSQILKKNPKYHIDITGVTDVYGPESYNTKLRVKRAQAVKELLVNKFGIHENRITLNTQKEKVQGKPYQHLNRRSSMLVYLPKK
ncbi:MAG: OmpA family protein [Flavobacteriales bacterium]|jgi:outer membrane protein OmpA-like peptidoglycan-associated protein|nr:OmpA family protein [Flavobacteriales bacterium]